MLIVIVLWY